jgi:hypothetical protein
MLRNILFSKITKQYRCQLRASFNTIDWGGGGLVPPCCLPNEGPFWKKQKVFKNAENQAPDS